MFSEFLTKIFGSRNDRLIKQYRRQCAAINKLEPAIHALSDEELKAKTQEFRDRLAKGEKLDALLPEAFAVVREASLRVTTAYGELGFGRMGRLLSDAGTYSQRGEFIIGSSWAGMTGGTEVITDKTSSRLDNMITYKSPTFGGVTVYAQYAGGDTAKADSEEENTSKTDRYYGLVAAGNWGAWSALLGVEQTNYASYVEGVGGKDVDDSVGVEASVAYDFGVVKTALTGRYFKDGAGYNTIVSDYQIDRIDGYGVKLAAAAPVLGGTLQGMVGYMDAESSDDEEFGDLEVSRYTVALTYDYPLSKRTKLYTAASYTKDDYKDNANSANDAKPNNTAFMFGMAHYF